MKLILVTANEFIANWRIGEYEISSRSVPFNDTLLMKFVRYSKLSPKGNVLAVPGVTGNMKFIRFNMPEYSPL